MKVGARSAPPGVARGSPGRRPAAATVTARRAVLRRRPGVASPRSEPALTPSLQTQKHPIDIYYDIRNARWTVYRRYIIQPLLLNNARLSARGLLYIYTVEAAVGRPAYIMAYIMYNIMAGQGFAWQCSCRRTARRSHRTARRSSSPQSTDT